MRDNNGDKIKLLAIIVFPALITASLIINTFYYNEANNSPILSIFADTTSAYMISLIIYLCGVVFDGVQNLVEEYAPKIEKLVQKIKKATKSKKEGNDKSKKP